MKIKDLNQLSSLDILSSAIYKTYAARLCGDGKILHIEERIGKKLLRTIDPLSKAGRELLNTQKVLFHMPDGELLRGKHAREAYQNLKQKTLGKMKQFAGDRELTEMLERTVESIERWEKLYIL